MYKIGFIDYYMSEWHANNYPKWFGEVCQQNGWDFSVNYAFAPVDVSPVDGVTTEEWCAKFGVERCNSIQELCQKSDFVVILAPSNPETHLELCREAFVHGRGKRMYVDKTFAPNLDVAKQICQLAEQNDVKFFSTSALRYCQDFDNLANVQSISTFFGGSNLEEYIIHQIESIVKVMAGTPTHVKAEKVEDATLFDIKFADGRVAQMKFVPDNWGYFAKISFADGSVVEKELTGGFFLHLSKKILNFFATGEIDFTNQQTLDVMAIRDKAIFAQENLSQWLKL